MHQIRRIGLTYYARVTIPKDRWEDVGRREVVRTLNTRDLKEARARRRKAVAAIHEEVSLELARRGLPPLDSGWTPSWQAEALSVRTEIATASDELAFPDADDHDALAGLTEKDIKRSVLFDHWEDLRDRLSPKQARQYLDVALGAATPIRLIADRWLRDVGGTLAGQTVAQHRTSLRYFGEFLGKATGERDPEVVLQTAGMEQVPRRVAGEFVEWLQQERGLSAKTTARHLSSLKTFWDWANDKGIIAETPWVGMAKGLKAKTRRAAKMDGIKRPYTPDEIEKLLRADPNEGRRWAYGAAIFDALRLALLTGARVNEICSLRRADITRKGTGLRVREEVAKTGRSVREIPLHAFAQSIIKARLADLSDVCDPEAPLFPELPPEGPDRKRSWRMSKAFPQFRRKVLGESSQVDFHSLRRTFATAWENAAGAGATQCTPLALRDLIGHERGDVTERSYIGRDREWSVYVRAVNGMVTRGLAPNVRKALEETAGNRPALQGNLLARGNSVSPKRRP